MNKYKRVLIKLSGEALAGDKGYGYDYDFLNDITKELVTLHQSGVQIALVVGGGNFWRGRQGGEMDRTTADQMGMLATVINGLALQDAIEQKGVKTSLQSSIAIEKVCETFTRRKAIEHFEKGEILIFAGGTGSPYFSTDTAAALRAAEIGADVILLAKNVDGIYDSDPKINKNAKKYDKISYIDFIKNGLKAMDVTAVTMCMENNMPILCFGLEKGALLNAINGKSTGTLIK